MSKITPCLWFDGQAEEAANFYAGLLPDSRVDKVVRAPADYPSGKKGDVLIVPKGTPHWFKQVDGTFLYLRIHNWIPAALPPYLRKCSAFPSSMPASTRLRRRSDTRAA